MNSTEQITRVETGTAAINVKGKLVNVPSLKINGRQIVVTGKILKTASVKEAEWIEGDVVENPEDFIAALKQFSPKPDIFTFAQQVGETEPKYKYPMEFDNVAAVPLSTYEDWWQKRLPQVSRKNVRRSERRGVVVKVVSFDDDLVRGITNIYNETPIRQGRRFWHYGKDFETVKKENSTYLDQSEFVGAYFEGGLIGFIKTVYVGRVARMMQILSLNGHFDKRPANAMIAKAIEACCQRGASHFLYGKYIYDNKANSPVTEFKRRNGFEQILVPTYYVPLTAQGRLALATKLHLGYKKRIPEKVTNVLLKARAKIYGWRGLKEITAAEEEKPEKNEKAAAE